MHSWKYVVGRDEICFVLRDVEDQRGIWSPCPLSFYGWLQKIIKGDLNFPFPLLLALYPRAPVDVRKIEFYSLPM